MNAMARFTLKSLRANRVRTAVTVAGVALAAALLTAVLTSFTSLTDFLYRAEATLSGDWMAAAQSDDTAALSAQASDAQEAGQIADSATLCDVGFGQLTEEQQSIHGHYLPLLSASGNVEQLCALAPSEGRMPLNGSEVLLSSLWKERSGVQLGDAIELPIGQRMAVLAPDAKGAAAEGGSISVAADYADYVEPSTWEIHDGTMLDSSIGYLDAEADGGNFNERLVDAQMRSFTVVGFYDRMRYVTNYGAGSAAFTADDDAPTGPATTYVTMDDVKSMDEVQERAENAFPDAHVEYHLALLRYLGVRGNGAVWNTFFGIAGVLGAVIVVACVSLIYNAFAISVAERTRQFGLLSSVGASKRQLRRAVMLEALLVALVGVPLGLLVGIGGCAVTFAVLGPSIASVAVGGFGADIPFVVAVEPWVLVLAACLTLTTVLLSVFVPAWRAGRTTAIEALRASGGNRLARRAQRRAARCTDASTLWKRRGVAGRIFGMGGMLARLNTKRGAAKGTTAAVSLALAIVLLMTAGSLNTFLGTLVDAATAGFRYDIGVSAQAKRDADEPVADQLARYQAAYAELCETPGAEPQGWTFYDMVNALVPADIAGEGIKAQAGSMPGRSAANDDGSYTGYASLRYLDDAAFDDLVRGLGDDPARFHDPEHPRAIATKNIYGNNGDVYELQAVFAGPGTVRINDVPLDIAQLTDDLPPIASSYGVPAIIVPLSLAYTQTFGADDPLFNAGFNAVDGDHEALADALSDKLDALFPTNEGSAIAWRSINDYRAEEEGNQMLATIINVFCLLFTVILALIAMGNVFNTVTNSLILRRREFAVMKSIGLSRRQFRAMIVDECASFGVKGLIPGMLVSVVVSYLLFRMVTQSMDGLPFSLPWAYVALAVGMTAAAMAVSVAFGMHRCRADNVVEALRMDSI